jgi:hypothetical protein
MKGTMPIVTCDDEYGCTEWEVDYYEVGATNWRALMGHWLYNPYDSNANTYCPEHAKGAGDLPAPTPIQST